MFNGQTMGESDEDERGSPWHSMRTDAENTAWRNADGDSVLHMISKLGLASHAKEVVRHEWGKDLIGCRNKTKRMPLHVAAEEGRADVVGVLIATREGRATIMEKSFERQIHDTLNPNHSTPLYLAVTNGHTEVVRLILETEEGKEMMLKDSEKCTPVEEASDKNQAEVMRALLETAEGRKCLGIVGIFGGTPLVWACRHGRLGVVRAILETEEGRRSLLQRGWFPFTVRNHGDLPIEMALRYRLHPVVAMILETEEGRQSLRCKVGKYDNTPVHVAAFGGTLWVFETLNQFEEGRRALRERNKLGQTPLHLAVMKGHAEVVQEILKTAEGRATITMGDDKNNNPLHMTSRMKRADIAKILLETAEGREAATIRNRYRETPRDKASVDDPEMQEVFREVMLNQRMSLMSLL